MIGNQNKNFSREQKILEGNQKFQKEAKYVGRKKNKNLKGNQKKLKGSLTSLGHRRNISYSFLVTFVDQVERKEAMNKNKFG